MNPNGQMEKTQLLLFILFTVVVMLLLVSIIFILFMVFNKKRINYLLEKKEIQRQAEIEYVRVRIETQEYLLKNISWELHDNIGQLLSVSKMQLSMLPEQQSESSKKIVNDTMEVLSKALEDVRSLTKSLNSESVGFMGLIKATGFEIDRLNRIKFINAKLNIVGIPTQLKSEDEIVLFRVIQELISNVIKHAKASEFLLSLNYSDTSLEIISQDNGVGIKTDTPNYGLGLKNIVSRIKLLNGNIEFKNNETGGLITKIVYPIQT